MTKRQRQCSGSGVSLAAAQSGFHSVFLMTVVWVACLCLASSGSRDSQRDGSVKRSQRAEFWVCGLWSVLMVCYLDQGAVSSADAARSLQRLRDDVPSGLFASTHDEGKCHGRLKW